MFLPPYAFQRIGLEHLMARRCGLGIPRVRMTVYQMLLFLSGRVLELRFLPLRRGAWGEYNRTCSSVSSLTYRARLWQLPNCSTVLQQSLLTCPLEIPRKIRFLPYRRSLDHRTHIECQHRGLFARQRFGIRSGLVWIPR